MTDVKISETIAAPAAKVWDILGDFGGVAKWGGAMMQSCKLEGEGVGAVRRIGLPGGLEIAERLESYDAAKRSFSYAIIGKSPIPIKNYLSVCSVVETGADSCRVDWNGSFEPDGVPEEQAKGMVSGIYTGGIAAIRKLLGV